MKICCCYIPKMSPRIGKSSKISVAAAIATVAAKIPNIARNANVSPPL